MTNKREPTKYRSVYRIRSSGKCCFRAKDRRGKWIERAGTTCPKTTELLRQQFEKHERLIRDGLVDPADDRRRELSRQPVEEVLGQFEAHMQGDRLSSGHVKTMVRYTKRVVAACSFTCLADVEPNAVELFLTRLLDKGRSFATRNRYLTAVKAFVDWAVESRALAENPLRSLHKLNEAKDSRRPNRALTGEEFDRLVKQAPTDRHRAFYLVAGMTGLRWSTIKRLKVGDFDLVGGNLRVGADIVKTANAQTIPLVHEVVEAVKTFLPAGAKPVDLVFGFQPDHRSWRRHLALAGIPYMDGSGRIADRKSLRKTFASHLIATGVKPRELQLLMGHKNIHTTMRFYSDPALVDIRGAVEKLSLHLGRTEPKPDKAAG